MAQEKKKSTRFIKKLRNKYKLVILNADTYEEKISFRLSRLNVFVLIGFITIILIAGTTLLIAFTPLREYIPGYTDVSLYKKLYRMTELTDSLQTDLKQKSQYIDNIRNILSGKDTSYHKVDVASDTFINYSDINIVPSKEDSMLREQIENQIVGNPYTLGSESRTPNRSSISSFSFLVPLRGIVTSKFDPLQKHFGVDIVAVKSEAIKATLDGVVILTGWTLETGYVIAIQHEHDLVSVYKHNSALLKEQGDIVHAGDPIAIVGSSGEMSTGPHLHFELWYNGVPIDPAEFMTF
jgi:murein DD-endopeptidase MepM/ murein hydrolase activator NlpD